MYQLICNPKTIDENFESFAWAQKKKKKKIVIAKASFFLRNIIN